MAVVRAAISEVVGLFVGDWSQAIGILVILGLGFVVVHFAHLPLGGFLVAGVLAGHLVYTSVTEARRGREG